MMEVIVSKRCTCCTHVLPIDRFRLRTNRGQRVRVAQCDQCEKGREAARQQLVRLARANDVRPSEQQRCNVLLGNWYVSVLPGLVGGRIGL